MECFVVTEVLITILSLHGKSWDLTMPEYIVDTDEVSLEAVRDGFPSFLGSRWEREEVFTDLSTESAVLMAERANGEKGDSSICTFHPGLRVNKCSMHEERILNKAFCEP